MFAAKAYFDNVLLLVDGETMFFGPVSQMTSHFNSIGCIAPESTDTPVTEHYLLQSDNIFGRPTLDMIDGYAGSQVDNANKALIQTHQVRVPPVRRYLLHKVAPAACCRLFAGPLEPESLCARSLSLCRVLSFSFSLSPHPLSLDFLFWFIADV